MPAIHIALIELEMLTLVFGGSNAGSQVVIFFQAATLVFAGPETGYVDSARDTGLAFRAMGAIHKATAAAKTVTDQQAVQAAVHGNMRIGYQIG